MAANPGIAEASTGNGANLSSYHTPRTSFSHDYHTPDEGDVNTPGLFAAYEPEGNPRNRPSIVEEDGGEIHSTSVNVVPGGDSSFQPLDCTPAPIKQVDRICHVLRWKLLTTYRKVFIIVFIPNLVAVLALLRTWIDSGPAYSQAAKAVSINLLVAVLARQEHFVNSFFRIPTFIPLSAPLSIRKQFAKIYGYGGLHSGCSIAALMWYILFTALATRNTIIAEHEWLPILILTYIVLALLIVLVTFAYPVLRSRLHNHFESTHRFIGWLAVVIFWAQTVLLARIASNQSGLSLLLQLLTSIPCWCLVVITTCIMYPWARMRRRKVHVVRLSSHAVRLYFDYANVNHCSALRLADQPLKETHAFAVIPEPYGQHGFSVIVSNAGDWTKRIIENPPDYLWTKGIPYLGVILMATMFKPVLVVATGSGIGPCLSLFNGNPELDCHVLWSAASPLATYGEGIIGSVLAADPNAVIFDTRVQGRPNLTQMAYDEFKKSGAEAVIVISNQRVTEEVVYGLQTRGVPAYGPIFDS